MYSIFVFITFIYCPKKSLVTYDIYSYNIYIYLHVQSTEVVCIDLLHYYKRQCLHTV